jgi:hypothetical protein
MATRDKEHRDPFAVIPDQDVLSSLLAAPAKAARETEGPPRTAAPIVAKMMAFDIDDRPMISYADGLKGELIVAKSTVNLLRSHLGSEVVVVCEAGELRKPIIIGVIQARAGSASAASESTPVAISADGQQHLITAEREIVLRCGDASITLTRAGKIILKGKYVLSRSSGVNKIKGAAVDIN